MKARLTFRTFLNPDTGRKEPGVRATAKVGNRTIFADGAHDQYALENLRVAIQEYETFQALKATYPKEVELS